jgi:hypothetical protein
MSGYPKRSALPMGAANVTEGKLLSDATEKGTDVATENVSPYARRQSSSHVTNADQARWNKTSKRL